MRYARSITIALLAITLFSFIGIGLRSAHAQPNTNPTTLAPDCDPTSGDLRIDGTGCGVDDFEDLLRTIVYYLAIIVVTISAGVILYAGIVIMIAGGSEEKIRHAKTMIITALWGIGIALGAWLIINAIFLALTGHGV
jgi:hypothetical protein